MDRPKWVTAVGIAGIVLGALGLIVSAQSFMLPGELAYQKANFEKILKGSEARHSHTCCKHAAAQPSPFTQTSGCAVRKPARTIPFASPEFIMMKLWEAPDWFEPWCNVAGTMGLIVSALYIFASINMLRSRVRAVRRFYWAAGANGLFYLINGIVTLIASPLAGIYSAQWGMASFGLNAVLIITAAYSDKQATH